MRNYSKWIGGGLGWFLGGPVGAIIGFAFGSVVDSSTSRSKILTSTGPSTAHDGFAASLVVLCATVMKADGKVLKSELDFVKNFFVRQFGEEKAQEAILMLRDVLKEEIQLTAIARQISIHVDHPSKLELIHLLFNIAKADGHIDFAEEKTINYIASLLDISASEYASIKAMFYKDTESAYRILEISKNSTDDEVKKAYRKMAVKYHPDKVSHLGDDFKQTAEEKFKKLNEAYNQIKKERGIK